MLSDLNRKIALKKFSEISNESCIVERYDSGQSLFEIARKSALGMAVAAATILPSQQQAYAEGARTPEISVAEKYRKAVERDIKKASYFGRDLYIDDLSVREIDHIDYNVTTAKGFSTLFGLISSGYTCEISYSTREAISLVYSSSIRMSKGFNQVPLNQINAVSGCAFLAFAKDGSIDQYSASTGTYLPLLDVISYAAIFKHSPEEASGFYEIVNGLAYAQLTDPSGRAVIEGIYRMGALRKIDEFSRTPGGMELLQGASTEQLVNLADMAMRSAMADLKLAKIADNSKLEDIDSRAIPNFEVLTSKLDQAFAFGILKNGEKAALFFREAGLVGVAAAIGDAEEAGITKKTGYNASMRALTCSEQFPGNNRHEKRNRIWCEFLKTGDWAVEGKTFIGDFDQLAKAMLSEDHDDPEVTIAYDY